MSDYNCGLKINFDDKPPVYERCFCEKPYSYHKIQSDKRINGKSKDEIRNDFIELCHELGFEPVL